jgi:3-keto-5-aminohexanoate cleavage enzyme
MSSDKKVPNTTGVNRRHILAAATVGTAMAGNSTLGSSARTISGITKKSIENTPVILECAINGSVTKAKNPLAPGTPAEHTAEIIKCLDAGATIIHSHSNQPNEDIKLAAQPYIDIYGPVWKKHPNAILYATANFDPKVYHSERRPWPAKVQCGHQRLLAEAGVVNMVLLDTGVVPIAGYDKKGVPSPDSAFWWYGFWPDDVRNILQTCKDLGTGSSISVFEPGWMKNVVAMARAGTIPPGSKLNIYFASDGMALCAPPIPEALELYLKMIEGLDLEWAVGYIGDKSVMDTPLARMALERGGSFRVGLEDWPNGISNVEQLKRAKEIIDSVGRPVVTGADAIKYLDIPFAATRPKA